MRILTIIAILAMAPHAALAEENLVSISLFETECREEMNLVDIILQPGKTKGDFRRCIRLKTANAKTKAETKRRRSTSDAQEQEILNKVLEIQNRLFGETMRSTESLRDQYNQECREKLKIGSSEVVQPGPKLGTLKRCIERMTSDASRAADGRRRRSSVQKRSEQIGEAVKKREEAELQQDLRRLDVNQRTRLKTQVKANPRRLKIIRESFRVRSFFSGERVDTRASQKLDAQSCRRVPVSQWGECIRKAMGGE